MKTIIFAFLLRCIYNEAPAILTRKKVHTLNIFSDYN